MTELKKGLKARSAHPTETEKNHFTVHPFPLTKHKDHSMRPAL